MLVKDIVYIIMDMVKLVSDDTILTEDHVITLCKNYRALLLKKEQEKNKGIANLTSEFDYQQICLDLEKVPAIDGEPCTGGYYLRTVQQIPKLLDNIKPKIYPIDYYQGINISYVSRDKMKYVGTNKFLKNIIYVSLGPDLHLYLNSVNPQFFYIKKLRMSAVFEDFDAASSLLCDNSGNTVSCDVLDTEFPISSYLVPQLIEMVVSNCIGASWRPKDGVNNANDDLADLATFINRNVKSALAKQIER